MEAVWKTVRGQLRVASGREFERTALHYLRVIWPEMIQAPSIQRLDQFGVDLCVPEEDRRFSVVIQAKGFLIEEGVTKSQVREQILPSIRKFLDSPLYCSEYVLLHNRDGSDRERAKEIEKELDELVKTGKAEKAYLWDLFTFVKAVRNNIDQIIREKLRKRSAQMRKRQESFFHFGSLRVSKVPLGTISWNPGSVVKQDFDAETFKDADAAKVIASPRKVRYALLIGAFGVGKTTTVLRAAESSEYLVVYVPAHTIRRDHGSQGTNYLLRNINDELDLLEDLPPDTSEVLGQVMGAALGRILRQANDAFVLVIDGLDEHAFYGTPAGLNWLTDELAELRCPIVLTTRREHFLSLIGNYEVATGGLSKKGGASRFVDVLHLGAWKPAHGKALIERAMDVTSDISQKSELSRLRDMVELGSSKLSARLLTHPLFLQITLDLIVDNEEWLIDDEEKLIEVWARKKIERDLTVPRMRQDSIIDTEYYVDSMLMAMEKVASEISANGLNQDESSALINADRVVAIVRECLDVTDIDENTIIATSLLVPASRRRGRTLSMKFFHRAFLDFFNRRATAKK